MNEPVSFWMGWLPRAVLSTNGDKREPRTPAHKAHAKRELGAEANKASVTSIREQPVWDGRVDVMLTFYVVPNTKLADCQRCLHRALESANREYGFNGQCLCYRPTDPSNVGGECAKPIIDSGLVGAGVIPDDKRKYVRSVTFVVEDADSIDDEGVFVTVREAVEENAA